MYIQRNEEGKIISYAANSIPVVSDTGDDEAGWEVCTDQQEIDDFLARK
jgi:hypothetical protein